MSTKTPPGITIGPGGKAMDSNGHQLHRCERCQALVRFLTVHSEECPQQMWGSFRKVTGALDRVFRAVDRLAELAPRCDHCPPPSTCGRGGETFRLLQDLQPFLGDDVWLREEREDVARILSHNVQLYIDTQLMTTGRGTPPTKVCLNEWDHLVLGAPQKTITVNGWWLDVVVWDVIGSLQVS